MIEIYPKGQLTFPRRGIALHPTSCKINYKAGAQYDLDMVFPLMDSGPVALEMELLEYGRVVRASVPPQHIPEITLGIISYWQVPSDAAKSVPLYKDMGYYKRVTYTSWISAAHYAVGAKVTYSNQNYQCTSAHGGVTTPPPQNPSLWRTIANYEYVPGNKLDDLEPGERFVKLSDVNSTWMYAATLAGRRGYIEKSKVEQVSEEEPYVLPARDIEAQPFLITRIKKNSNAGTVSVHAMHQSYLLNGILMGDCSLVSANPNTALSFIGGTMMSEWPGLLVTDITEPDVTADYSWGMAGNALLNPSSGFVATLNARLIRDGLDVLILKNEETPPVYAVAYGVNMLGVDWDGNIDNFVSRIYPRAKKADGTALMLPEVYIETTRETPYDAMELLDLELTVGQKEEQTDGTSITLTEEIIYQRMRDAANERFEVDRCDQPSVSLSLDYTRMGDTEEYRQYWGLETVNPYDWIAVRHGPMGIAAVIQMIGYTWDAVLRRYDKSTFGDARNYYGKNVTDWDLRSGSVTIRSLSEQLKKKLGV